MDIRTLAAGRGWDWIVEGFKIFRRQPLTWIVLAVVATLINFGSVIPLIGMVVIMLMPAILAGLMLAAETTDKGGEPEFNQLFAALKTHTSPLVTVGGVLLVGNIIMSGIVIGLGSDGLQLLMGKSGADLETLRFAMISFFRAVAIGLAVFLPFVMATWFAPLLIVFRNTPPVEAMKLSFTACLRNTMSLLIYGIAAVGLWILATIPLMLGFIVLLPVLVCSIYASYKDIFPADTAAPAQEQNS